MNIYKISLGNAFFNDTSYTKLISNNLISIHPDTSAKGQSSTSQGDLFLKADKGDLFYVCRSNDSIELIGMFKDYRPLYSIINDHEDWVDREYCLIATATSKNNYNKGYDKWWMPKNNSTYIRIDKSDYSLFEKKILQPVFNTDLNQMKSLRDIAMKQESFKIEDLVEYQKYFQKLNHNESYLFQEVNNIQEIELKKIEFEYHQKGNIDHQPLVLLRKHILTDLLNHKGITSGIISQLKAPIASQFKKNVFKAWKSSFRILYPFLYSEVKQPLINFMNDLIKEIQDRLDISKQTKIKLVHFDGPQNQGCDTIWFAIYNKSHKTQKGAKQLFFKIDKGVFEFGLLDHANTSNNSLDTSPDFDLNQIIEKFKSHKTEILHDNLKENIMLSNIIDILDYKKQIILQGPPGTGKTYNAKKLAKLLTSDNKRSILELSSIIDYLKVGVTFNSYKGKTEYTISELTDKSVKLTSKGSNQSNTASYDKILERIFELEQGNKLSDKNGNDPYECAVAQYIYNNGLPKEQPSTKLIQFHPSYSYEDFVRGISAKTIDKQIHYSTENKVFAEYSEYALNNPDNNYVLIIDEINRANLPSVLGELIYALEYRGDSVECMYALDGDTSIVIPENLYIIGTMNTADRSVGHIDYAIRRRFAFENILPNEAVIENEKAKELFGQVSELFVQVDKNDKKKNSDFLAPDFDYKDVQLGHSYFMLKDDTSEELQMRLQYEILPILNEYVKDGLLLETAKVEIEKIASFEC